MRRRLAQGPEAGARGDLARGRLVASVPPLRPNARPVGRPHGDCETEAPGPRPEAARARRLRARNGSLSPEVGLLTPGSSLPRAFPGPTVPVASLGFAPRSQCRDRAGFPPASLFTARTGCLPAGTATTERLCDCRFHLCRSEMGGQPAIRAQPGRTDGQRSRIGENGGAVASADDRVPKAYRHRLHRLKNAYRKAYRREPVFERPVTEEAAIDTIALLEQALDQAGVNLPDDEGSQTPRRRRRKG
jgi:hypothetical protein